MKVTRSADSTLQKSLRAKWLREIDENSYEFRREALSSVNFDKDKSKTELNNIPESDTESISNINPYTTLRQCRKNNRSKTKSDVPEIEDSDSSSNESESPNNTPEKSSPLKKPHSCKLPPPSMAVIKISKPKRKGLKHSVSEKRSKTRAINSERNMNQRPEMVNSVSKFKSTYIRACQSMRIAAKEDIVEMLHVHAKNKLSILDLDLSYLNLTREDVDALASAFCETYRSINKLSKDSVTVNMIEPRELNLKRNNIQDGICIGSLILTISTVTSLNISNNNLGPAASGLAKTIFGYKHLTNLSICGNNIGSKAAIDLLNVFAKHKVLEKIELGENNLDETVSESVILAIRECPLIFLSLKYNKIGPKGAKKIIGALRAKPSLVEIDLTDTSLGSATKKFVELPTNYQMRRICIGLNECSPSFALNFPTYLHKIKTLEVLDVRYMNIPQKSMKDMLKALLLASVSTMRELVLSGNTIDDKTMEVLIELIKKATQLNTIGLRGCGLSSKAVLNICNALVDNRSVKVLELSGNSIKHKNSVSALCNLIRINSRIKVLSLMGTKIDRKSIGTIGLALQSSKRIQKLYLDGNRIGDRGIQEFAGCVVGNQSLRVMSIKATKVSLKGFSKALKVLEFQSRIELIDLRDNNIPPSNVHKLPASNIFVKLF